MSSSTTKQFLILTLLLVGVGFLIFSSASLGLLSRDGATYSQVATSQFLFGIAGGFVALLITSRIPLSWLRRIAPYLFVVALLGMTLVFFPGIGFSYNGAHRWVHVLGVSFQPSEFLKIAAVTFYAGILAATYKRITSWRSLVPFAFVAGISATAILSGKDTGTCLILMSALTAMYFAAGAPWRHFAFLTLLFVMLLGVLLMVRPYALERVKTFMDPSRDPLGASYQLRQSLIAVGSGGFAGRGFGQSVQKFSYLPEPTGDSIFSVAAEEFGFIGGTAILALFALFALTGYRIARRAKAPFGMFLAIGLVTLIAAQALINIAAMLGLIPLTGVPLVFISHGGTALLSALAAVGLILNIARSGVSLRS